MGFRGSRVQIPPSRLVKESALQRVPLWGFFFALPRAVSNAVSPHPLAPLPSGEGDRHSQLFTGGEVLADGVPDVLQRFFFRRSLRPAAGESRNRDAVAFIRPLQRNLILHRLTSRGLHRLAIRCVGCSTTFLIVSAS